MIEVNLLPEEMRIPEHTPYPRLIAILSGVALIMISVAFALYVWWSPVSAAEVAMINAQKNKAASEKELTALNKLASSEWDKGIWGKQMTYLDKERFPLGTRFFQLYEMMPKGMWFDKFEFVVKEGKASAKSVGGPMMERSISIEGSIADPEYTNVEVPNDKIPEVNNRLTQALQGFKKTIIEKKLEAEKSSDSSAFGWDVDDVKITKSSADMEETTKKDAPPVITKEDKGKNTIKVPILKFTIEITLKSVESVDFTKKPKVEKKAKDKKAPQKK